MGYTIDGETLQQVYESFKRLSDKKKNVYDEDIEALVEDQIDSSVVNETWKLISVQVTSGTGAIPTATIVLGDASGLQMTDASTGDGPIDAIYSTIQRITGVGVELLDYQIRAITHGKDAQGEVIVDVRHNDLRIRGRGVSTDVIEASARAYLTAINRIRNVTRRDQAAIAKA
jgi:2-isopropylmalate synthase